MFEYIQVVSYRPWYLSGEMYSRNDGKRMDKADGFDIGFCLPYSIVLWLPFFLALWW